MRFFAIAAALASVAVASFTVAGPPQTCSVVTVTVTETVKHPHSVPSSSLPTEGEAYPSAPVEASSSAPAYGAPYPISSASKVYGGIGGAYGTAAPTGTAATTSSYPVFTGAASNVKVGGLMAGVAGAAALFL